jgi:hypothetical protein
MPVQKKEMSETRLARLRWIEQLWYWRGWVVSGDVIKRFGVTRQVASADFQYYQEVNAGAVIYDSGRKRYEAMEGLRCVFYEPQFVDAVREVIGSDSWAGVSGELGMRAPLDPVCVLSAPERRARPEVERTVVRAMLAQRWMEMTYLSMTSGKKKRRIVPVALAHSGMRWHVRGWCEENKDYRDFVLSRIEQVRWQGFDTMDSPTLPRDAAWQETVELRFSLKKSLTAEQRRALMYDYDLPKDGVLRWRVRGALKGYAEMLLGMKNTFGKEAPTWPWFEPMK